MNTADGLKKRTIILVIILVVITGGAGAYFFYFRDTGTAPAPEPEKVVKRVKIEVPATADKKEAIAPGSMPAQAPPSAAVQAPTPQKEVAKPAPPQPAVAKKEEVKPAVKEVAPEKKIVAQKEKSKPAVKRNLTYTEMKYKPWAVHVASYRSMEEAQAIVKKLKQDNYNAYLTEFNLKGRQWYRVRIGFYALEKEAKEIGKKISSSYNISGIWTVKPVKKEVITHLNFKNG
ncbi:MAG: SPOR domain-containing protein [Deltaproteobacteria bacterium]|nr:SPOR domain-containing protein [Deltaproteobacteria bacterium]